MISLVLAMAASDAQAAKVVQVTGRTTASAHGEAYLQLAPREVLQKGDKLSGPGGVAIPVLEVVGRRARVQLSRRGALRKGDSISTPASGNKKPPAELPQLTDWKVKGGDAGTAGDPTLWPAAWRRLRVAGRTLIEARTGLGTGLPAGRLRGDMTLIGYGLLGPGGGLGAVRLSSRLDVPQVAGLPLDYRHELSLYLDSIGTDQGGFRARRPLEVRRLELALAVDPGRAWGGRLGRVVVADGAGQQVVDGAAASYLVGEAVQVDVYGGVGPDMVSLAPRFDVGRFGAGATWQGRLFGAAALASLAWGGSTFDGGLDRQLLGTRLHMNLPWGGRLQGQFDAALQQPDQGADGGATTAKAPLQPHRAWLSLSSPEFAGWRARLRYSYYRAMPDRELLATMNWHVFTASRQHDLYLQFDGPQGDGWWWMPALWAGHRATDDKMHGFRVGGTVRAGLNAGRWTWSTALSGQSPISRQAMAWIGGALRGGALSLGCRWRYNDALALSGRLSGHMDEVLPIETTAWRAGARLGVDWMRGPWLVDVGVGLDKGIVVDTPWAKDAVDWLDATLMVRRAF